MQKRWFDLSFTAAVPLLFAVVLMLWLNFYPRMEADEGTLPSVTQFYGWPLEAATVSEIWEGEGGYAIDWNIMALGIDAAAIAVILAFTIAIGHRLTSAVAATQRKWLAQPWHNLHSTTAVALAVTASGILWTNFVWQDMGDITVKLSDEAVDELRQDGIRFRITDDGQPVDFKFIEMKQQGAGWPLVFRYQPESFLWVGSRLLADVLFGLVLLVGVYVVCEEYVRRHDNPKGFQRLAGG